MLPPSTAGRSRSCRPHSSPSATAALATAGLVGVQTPQAFAARALLGAYRQADADGFVGTDTAACLERYADIVVAGVPSTTANLKVTFAEDVALAERCSLASS